jgi:hypothetical protein
MPGVIAVSRSPCSRESRSRTWSSSSRAARPRIGAIRLATCRCGRPSLLRATASSERTCSSTARRWGPPTPSTPWHSFRRARFPRSVIGTRSTARSACVGVCGHCRVDGAFHVAESRFLPLVALGFETRKAGAFGGSGLSCSSGRLRGEDGSTKGSCKPHDSWCHSSGPPGLREGVAAFPARSHWAGKRAWLSRRPWGRDR